MKTLGLLTVLLMSAQGMAALIPFSAADLNNNKHTGWIAKENHLTKQRKEDLKRLMGVRDFQQKDIRFSELQYMTPMAVETVDWRNQDGKNWLGPMMDQANCGSCVAFAAVATLEGQVAISNNFPGLNPQFSTEALFACGGGRCEWGWTPASASNYMQSKGVVDEACAPYTMGATGQDVSCNKVVCSDSKERTYKVAGVTRPNYNENINAVKAALKKGPLMTTLGVYEDFMFYSSGIYKHSTGEYLGGHAVSLVGFSDEKKAWLIRNSWAEDWGDKGYGWISWDDTSGVGDETWGYTIASSEGFASVRAPRTYDYVSGKFEVQSEATFPNLVAQTVTITQNGKTVKSIACGAGSSCVDSVDSSDMADGKYTIQSIAQTTTGVKKSLPEFFYVVNKEPNLSIALKL